MPNQNDFSCECQTGTFGKNCEIDIDECLSQPCLNNGTCVETSINAFTCICAQNYLGVNCDIYVLI